MLGEPPRGAADHGGAAHRETTIITAALVATLAATAGCGGDGGSENSGGDAAKPTRTVEAKARQPQLVTRVGFSRCLRKAGVAFDRGGAVPGDPDRIKRPRGWNPPAEGAFARARYFGAVGFKQGGFTDVWIAESVARAAELSASFEDPSLNEAEAEDWYFDHNRNVLFAFHAPTPLKLGDPSGKRFDACLRDAP